ncbi:MAG: hypothetical protein ACYC3G_01595 [Minisyncoccota bacterium]
MEEKEHIHNEKCNIYGIDMHAESATPEQVRDAIVQCFLRAHGDILKDFKSYENLSEEEFEKIKLTDVLTLIRNFFYETNGDFDKPTKESLLKVIDKLANFSRKFRSSEEVEEHHKELTSLINKIK